MHVVGVYFYSTNGDSLNTNVPDLDLNALQKPLNIFNTKVAINHTYYTCGKVKAIDSYPLGSYYIENNINIHIFVSDPISYKYEHFSDIGSFVSKVLNIHELNIENSPELNIYLPNIRTPVTEIASHGRFSANNLLLQHLSRYRLNVF